jgi:hypothetical protein
LTGRSYLFSQNLSGVKEQKNAIYKGARLILNEQLLDVQAATQSDIGVDKMLLICGRLFSLKVPGTHDHLL